MNDTATDTQRLTLRIGHSPDPDDAFMWYPLANFTGPDGTRLSPKIDTGGFDFVHVLEDIQALNERSDRGELEITALSIHQYPYVANRYALTSCGASLGDGFGPMLVTPKSKQLTLGSLPVARLAIPGTRTSAWLALQLLLREQGADRIDRLDWEVVPFDQIIPKVAAGEYDAGLIIHEGQLTYAEAGLDCLVDLGQWWGETRGLPLPLGGNAIRRDLDPHLPRICDVLLRSIQWALDHRAESVQFALNYARDMGQALADEFVGMYVNQWTLDYGEQGREAVRRFLGEAKTAGLVPDFGAVDFIEPAR